MLALLLVLSSIATAAYIRDIEIKPEEIEPKGEFEVIVDIGGTTYGRQLNIFIDDERFSSKNIGGETDEVKTDEWDLGDDPLDCGIHTIRAELSDGSILESTKTLEISIGNVPTIRVEPTTPTPN